MPHTPTGRFAPSPTGELHLGNARTALLAWLWTRSMGGSFVLRVEDLDKPRVRPGMAQQQLDELRWLGLDWDFGPDRGGPHAPYTQSERSALYADAVTRLAREGLVYPCFCSRAEIKARSEASAPHGPQDEGPRYTGTCARLSSAQIAERSRTRAPALRLRVPSGPVEFTDAIAGPQTFDPQSEIGDFVLQRADGIYSYQLAVTVDDAAMGITQVLRGADLLPSTARQLVLYRFLEHAPPQFAHAPLVFGPKGPDGQPQRLAKRDPAVTLAGLKKTSDTSDPRVIIGKLASISGLSSSPEPRLPRDFLATFDLARIPKGPVELAP
ncbi:MAG: tRNA glutamyl-Q(34) synthetase GluQRS [Deltaproteobacteria bacterium]|nr:tRNA glutamyl-Q(34) synthetase GluQRS [Deltaproteobacteria bacterium]